MSEFSNETIEALANQTVHILVINIEAQDMKIGHSYGGSLGINNIWCAAKQAILNEAVHCFSQHNQGGVANIFKNHNNILDSDMEGKKKQMKLIIDKIAETAKGKVLSDELSSLNKPAAMTKIKFEMRLHTDNTRFIQSLLQESSCSSLTSFLGGGGVGGGGGGGKAMTEEEAIELQEFRLAKRKKEEEEENDAQHYAEYQKAEAKKAREADVGYQEYLKSNQA